MSRFAVDHLSPLAARRRLEEVDLEEKSRLAEGLALIALIDSRGDYLEAGYSCMQRYCIEHLRMSEAKTLRRLQAARLGRKFPQVFERISDGRLSVSNACEIAPVLTEENAAALLDAVTHQPKLQVRRIVIAAKRPSPSPQSAPTEKRECEASAEPNTAPAADVSLSELCDVASPDTGLTEHAPARVNRQVRGRVIVTQQGERGLQLVLTDEEFVAFKKAQDLLSHVVCNGDPAVVVARALAHYATHLEKRRFGAKDGKSESKRIPRGRHVPAALRRAVAERDEHCCSFVSADGHRCGETRGLQIDHITPLAHGGETTGDNLRLLCAHHNRHEAAKRIGVEEVAAKRELNERARAHERAAKQREAVRERERAVTPPESGADSEAAELAAARERARRQSDIDTVAALRWMGISLDEAQLAADRTKELADGPTGKRVMVARRFCGTRFGRKQDFRPKVESTEAHSGSASPAAEDAA